MTGVAAAISRPSSPPRCLPAEDVSARALLRRLLVPSGDVDRADVGPCFADEILALAIEMVGVDDGWVHLLVPGGREMVVAAARGALRPYLGERCEFGSGVGGKVWATRRPLRVVDYGSWEGRAFVVEEGACRSVLAVPVGTESCFFGVLAVSAPVPGRFDVACQEVLVRLGRLAGTLAAELLPEFADSLESSPVAVEPALLPGFVLDSLERADFGVAVASTDLRLVACNPALAELLSSTPAELVGRNLLDLAEPAGREAMGETLAALLDGPCHAARLQAHLRPTCAPTVPVEMISTLLTDQAGGAAFFFCQIFTRMGPGDALDAPSHPKCRTAPGEPLGSMAPASGRSDARAVVDLDGRIRAVDCGFTEVFAVDPITVAQRGVQVGEVLHPPARLLRELAALVRDPSPKRVFLEGRTWSGRWVRLAATLALEGEAVSLDLKLLSHDSSGDGAGCFGPMLRYMGACSEEAERGGHRLFAILVQIEGHRHLVQSWGPREARRAIDRTLQSISTEGLTGARAVRLADDLAGFVGITEQQVALEVDLLNRRVAGRDLPLRFAVGSAPIGPDPERTLSRILASLERSRETGTLHLFDSRVQRRVDVDRILLDELATRNFTGLHPVFQPIIDATTGAVFALEVLARWNHPRLGQLSPLDFVPAAHTVGLSGELAHRIESEALAEFAALRKLPKSGPALVSLNMATELLVEPAQHELLRARVEGAGLRPDQVLLEILESAFGSYEEGVRRGIERLRDMGFRIAIDDFGKGFSSLGRLAAVEASMVKLDRALVNGSVASDRGRTVLRAAVELARSVGADVVAEGIETLAVHRAAAVEGCRLVQGFLYARPMAPAALSAWLRSSLDFTPAT